MIVSDCGWQGCESSGCQLAVTGHKQVVVIVMIAILSVART